MNKEKIIFVSIAVLSALIVVLTIFNFYADSEIAKYEDEKYDLLVQHDNSLMYLISAEEQLTAYLQVLPFTKDYVLYNGKENLDKLISDSKAEVEKLNSDVNSLAAEINQLREEGTPWESTKRTSHLVTLIVALVNSLLIVYLATSKKSA